MKRLDTLAPHVPFTSFELQPTKVHEFRIRRDTSHDCPLEYFSPVHYEAGYAYPLIVWLHGAHDNENQIRRIMPHTSDRNFVAVGPRGVAQDFSQSCETTTWNWPQDSSGIELASKRISLAIQRATHHFHVNPNRIYLAGFRDGGTMALRMALQQPSRFAGVISINGALPSGNAPFSNLAEMNELPIMVMQCQQSCYYPEDQLCDDLRLAHSAGLKLDVRQYLCGDVMMTDMLEDMNSWVMQKIVG